ncbi:MAG: type 4a pilus biogenesis protein PilO [Candidatus Sumerlaeaceae bacterium]|nr:type 4a pilus biogenesis protein PilO [Candidatus Sumerlaeaceae bacterium]
MAQLTPREKETLKGLGILTVIVLAAAIYYDFQFARPEIQSIGKKVGTVSAEVTAMDNRIKEINVALAHAEDLLRKEAMLKKIAAKLPDSPDAPGFFQALVEFLKTTRIAYTDLSPEPNLERSAYIEIPYKIKCSGRYHSFGQFLNLIEENPFRFMRVKTFTVENQDTRPSLHPISVEIGTFTFKKRG